MQFLLGWIQKHQVGYFLAWELEGSLVESLVVIFVMWSDQSSMTEK